MKVGETIKVKIRAADPGGPGYRSGKVIWISSDGKTVAAQTRGRKKTVFLIDLSNLTE